MINKKNILLLGLFDTAITTARCFPQKDFIIHGMDYNEKLLGFKSRLIISKLLPNLNIDEKETLTFLQTWLKSQNKDIIIIPTSDEFILFVAKYRKELPNNAKFLIPDFSTITDLISRDIQFKSAEKCGLNVPPVLTEAEIIDGNKSNVFPVAIKPLDVNEWKRYFNKKGFVINDLLEFKDKLKVVKQSGAKFIIQKIITGDNSNNFEVNSLLLPGGKVYQHSIQKIRQFPDGFGTATAIKAVNMPKLEEYAKQFIIDQNLVGFSNIEFKYNSFDNKYYYIETNPRVWLQVNYTNKIGLNLPMIYFNYLIGNDKNSSFKVQNKGNWVDFLPDLLFYIRYRKEKKLSFFHYFKTWIGTKSTDLFSITDPNPFLSELVSKFKIKN